MVDADTAPRMARYGVLALLCGLSAITYLDRVCFGAAGPEIAAALSLDSVAALKWAFTAFAIAYAVFEVPAGWMGDRFGPRRTLIRIVAWWSTFTALTAIAGLSINGVFVGQLTTIIVIRFLFGAGEAGAYPNITRAIHNWFPQRQWEFAQGMVWMSGRLMGGLTPLVWSLLVSGPTPIVTWRGAFVLFGALGGLWLLAFAVFFRDHPPNQAGLPARPIDVIPSEPTSLSVPWRELLCNRSLIALCLLYSLVNYGWAFHFTFLPSYLKERFDLADGDKLGALYKGAPLWVGAAGCFLGGIVVNTLARFTKDRVTARQTLGVAAMLGCALCWFSAVQARNVHVFCISLSLAAFCVDLTLGSAWASCQDIGGRFAGVAAACMNTIGTLGSALASWVTGAIVERSIAAAAMASNTTVAGLAKEVKSAASLAGFQTAFATFSAIYVIAAVCWLWVRPRP